MRWLAVLTVGALAALALMWMTQRRLIYFPTQAVPDAATFLPGVEEVTYPTEDGLSLAAWQKFDIFVNLRAKLAPLSTDVSGKRFKCL